MKMLYRHRDYIAQYIKNLVNIRDYEISSLEYIKQVQMKKRANKNIMFAFSPVTHFYFFAYLQIC